MSGRRPRRRPPTSSLVLRWLAVGALALCAFLYYRPLAAYVETRARLDERRAEVRALRAEKRDLEQRLAFSSSESALAREARRLGYVKPGERLFIVKGIEQWRKRQRSSIDRDERR